MSVYNNDINTVLKKKIGNINDERPREKKTVCLTKNSRYVSCNRNFLGRRSEGGVNLSNNNYGKGLNRKGSPAGAGVRRT